jgi:hypothetical protein
MRTITIYMLDGSTTKHSCDDLRIEQGVLCISRSRSTTYYYPLTSIKYYEVER